MTIVHQINRRALAITTSLVIAVSLFALLKVTWLPWISPSYAADLLAKDDGLGIVVWAPSAAKFWGARVIEPLSHSTEGFSKLRPVAAHTLLDIVSRDQGHELTQATPILLAANSSVGRMLGLLAANRAEMFIPEHSARVNEVRQLAMQVVTENDTTTEIALRVAGMTGMDEVAPALVRNLASDTTPSLVVSASCIAAAGLPINNEVLEVLQLAMAKPNFPDRPACARALVSKIGARARRQIEAAIILESDEGYRRALVTMLDGLPQSVGQP
jgi:hypothetical protein